MGKPGLRGSSGQEYSPMRSSKYSSEFFGKKIHGTNGVSFLMMNSTTAFMVENCIFAELNLLLEPNSGVELDFIKHGVLYWISAVTRIYLRSKHELMLSFFHKILGAVVLDDGTVDYFIKELCLFCSIGHSARER
eukprot:snap_masked-scaffold_10-processed-gene-10.16-mRNA-1 protein AED:1.00 eAED:1.00 QI:0/0/0/0/1/1/2/0/134